jgi:hypothetical protein
MGAASRKLISTEATGPPKPDRFSLNILILDYVIYLALLHVLA